MHQPLSKRVVAEALGTFFLLAAVVGSGIMAERLAGGNTALPLLANTAATGSCTCRFEHKFQPNVILDRLKLAAAIKEIGST